MHSVTYHFQVSSSPDRLIASLRKRRGAFLLLTTILTFGAIAFVPLLGIFAYHFALVGNSAFLGLEVLFAVPFFWSAVSQMHPKSLVLDKLRNRVSFEGETLFDLTDLLHVEVNRYSFVGPKVTSVMVQLNLITKRGGKMTIWESVAFSREEMEEVGQAVAGFADADLVCASEFPQMQDAV